MNVDKGRKVQVQVMFTVALLEKVDAIAESEAEDGEEPNRSRVARALMNEAIEARGKGAAQ